MKKYDITALGELLIDFTQTGYSESGMRLFEQNPGGAVANVLVAAAKFGKKTAFIGKVGRDMHGAFLRRTLEDAGVDVSGLVEDPAVFTTLAFVELSSSGERTFSFARKPGADTMLRPGELDMELLRSTKILHIGSLSMTDEPARSATLCAIEASKEAGAVISYDPNYRAALWENRDEAVRQMRSLLPYADLVKISDEEVELLTGCTNPSDAARCLNDARVTCAAVSLGSKGALVSIRGEQRTVPAFRANAVDTTGAGDAFWGGFLQHFLDLGVEPAALTLDKAALCAEYGCAVAALCIQKRGAIPAMPAANEVLALINDAPVRQI